MQPTNVRDRIQDQRAALLQNVLNMLGPGALADPDLPDALQRVIDRTIYGAAPQAKAAQSADGGLAALIGIGDDSVGSLGDALASPGVENYDDQLKSERVLATADLYYLYMHE